MKFRALALLSLGFVSVGAATGCVWISEEEVAAFNDRDNDGVDHDQDCDDNNKAIQGTVRFYQDVDGDGFGDVNAQPKEFCPGEAPADHVQDNTDCNDNNADAKPGGVEVCDPQNIDEDCDGSADDADAEADGKVLWYEDADGDTFGDVSDPGVLACDPPTGVEVTDNTDCDDARDDVNPDGTEVCDPDNADEDCNGFADDEAGSGVDPASRIQYYADADGDGYGNPAVVGAIQCDPPGGQAPNNGDCNDANGAIHPAATEVCDALDVDENCNAQADDADPGADVSTMSLWYPDGDGDGFGDEFAAAVQACDPLPDEVSDNTDCDDSRSDVNTSAPEVCDLANADEDCDGLSNDADPDAQQTSWWADNDGDGYGANGPPATTACIAPPNHADQSGDCNDGDPTINPGAKEYHDGIDSDCDALSTDWVCGESYLRVGPAMAFTSIQAAVNAVDQVTYCDGDTIEVLPGTYNENVVVADKSPNVVGLVGPGTTIIQGTGTTRAVSLDRTSARFEGFTVQGGVVAGDGGGIRVFYGNGTVVDNVIVTGNSAVNGGGMEVRNPTNVTVSNSVIDGNSTTSGDGGGIRVSSTGGQSAGQVVLTGLDIIGNHAGDEGGGLRLTMDTASGANGLTVLVEDTVIDANDAVTAGGISADIVPGFTLRNVDVIDNIGAANHGGVQIRNSAVLIDGMLLEGNEGVTVAGMQIQDYTAGVVTLRDVVAIDNVLTQLTGNGSAILLKGDTTSGSVLERVEVARTVRLPGSVWGAGLTIEGKVDADNVLVYDERGPAGLGLAESTSGTPATHAITNATVVGNDEDGIYVGQAVATSTTFVNVISAFNGGYGVNQALLNATVSSSDVYQNASGDFAGNNPIGTNGVISQNPTFTSYSAVTNSTTWNLTLGAGSPCRDAGDVSISDPDGSQSDMGYYGGPGAP